MEDRLNELPKGWVWSTLGEISEVILGQSPPSSTYNEVGKGLPFYQGKLEFGDIYPSPQKWCSSPKKIAEKNDILISVRAPVGPTNISPEKSCIGRGLAAIRPMGGIESFFVLYLIRAFERNVAEHGTGTTFNAITGGQLSGFGIHLPPLPEQHRIVAKIEELFTRLDAGVEALEKIKAQLKRYRQAVLKYAFEGKLTQEWREANKGKIEPASVLLERIREQRNVGADLRVCRNKKGEHIGSPLQKDLPSLPEGWVWTRMEEISEKITDGTHSTPTYVDNGIPFISVKDVFGGGINFDNRKYIPEKEHNDLIKRCHPEYRDILITKSGTIGRTAVVKTKKPFSLFVSVALIKPSKKFIDSDFIAFSLENYINSIDIQQSVKGGVIKNLHVEDLKEITIPLSSTAEQEKIVREIESRLSIADNMEKVAEQSLKQSERLRQSILKRAFEGKLVPQDPTDLPAVELLKQIKEEREASVTSGKKKKNEKEFKK
jgi:type I restriction enzyme S subunit